MVLEVFVYRDHSNLFINGQQATIDGEGRSTRSLGNGVVALSEGVELIEEPLDLPVGVAEECRKDFLEPRRQALFVGVQLVPRLYAGVARRESLILGQQA